MNLLALDLATKTGWSTNIHGRCAGVIEFPIKRGESPGMRFLLEYAMDELGVNNIGASVAQVGQEIHLNESELT